MPQEQYFVAPHVFLRRTPYHWLLLDVISDKYLCIHRRDFEHLQPFLGNTSGGGIATIPPRAAVPTKAAELMEALAAKGILTKVPNDLKKLEDPALPAPTAVLDLARHRCSTVSCLIHASAFFFSASKADYRLRHLSFARNIQTVRERKDNCNANQAHLDVTKTTILVAAFNRLRWFYPRDYLCLFDSFALIEYLALYSIYPNWVFGVMTDPFQAHCWVQAGDTVLNDSLERTSSYLSIMNV